MCTCVCGGQGVVEASDCFCARLFSHFSTPASFRLRSTSPVIQSLCPTTHRKMGKQNSRHGVSDGIAPHISSTASATPPAVPLWKNVGPAHCLSPGGLPGEQR